MKHNAGGICIYVWIGLLLSGIAPLYGVRLSKRERRMRERFLVQDVQLKERLDMLMQRSDIQEAFEKKDADYLKTQGFIIHPTLYGNIVAEHPHFEGWLVKYPKHYIDFNRNVRRVLVAHKIRRFIRRKQFSSVCIPRELLYHVPGRGKKITGKNYVVISEKFDLVKNSLFPMSRETKRQVYQVIRKVGYWDAHEDNICRMRNGKVAFIDTEPFLTSDAWLWRQVDCSVMRVLLGCIGAFRFRIRSRQARYSGHAKLCAMG